MMNKVLLCGCLLLLAACDSPSDITTVDKDQEYTPPETAVINMYTVPPATVASVCQPPEGHVYEGCTMYLSPTDVYIFISSAYHNRKDLMEHEFFHVIYGPTHEED